VRFLDFLDSPKTESIMAVAGWLRRHNRPLKVSADFSGSVVRGLQQILPEVGSSMVPPTYPLRVSMISLIAWLIFCRVNIMLRANHFSSQTFFN